MPELRNAPTQDRARSTIDAVIAAVDEVMGTVGVDKATLTEVAESAGVSIGTLYRYFPNKTALVREYVARYQAMLEAQTAAFALASRNADIGDVDELAMAFIQRSAQLFADHPAYRHIRGWYDEELGELVSAPIHAQERALLVRLIRAEERGLPSEKAEQIAEICIETVMHLISLAPGGSCSPDHLEEIAHLISAYLRNGAERYPLRSGVGGGAEARAQPIGAEEATS